jgi:hypothetical protein
MLYVPEKLCMMLLWTVQVKIGESDGSIVQVMLSWSPLLACAATEEIYVAVDAVAACGRTAWLTTTTLSASRRGVLINPRTRPGERRTLQKAPQPILYHRRYLV